MGSPSASLASMVVTFVVFSSTEYSMTPTSWGAVLLESDVSLVLLEPPPQADMQATDINEKRSRDMRPSKDSLRWIIHEPSRICRINPSIINSDCPTSAVVCHDFPRCRGDEGYLEYSQSPLARPLEILVRPPGPSPLGLESPPLPWACNRG